MKTPVERLFADYIVREADLLQNFFTLLRFHSISSEKEFAPHVRECAEWVLNYVREIGFEAEIWEGSGHPTIYAERLDAGPDKPTVLIYNHYDVQPVDPHEHWHTPPFEPTVVDGQVYCRGAQDDKGQMFYVLAALGYLIERDGKLPVNVKLVIEGEEECGSSTLSEQLKNPPRDLSADGLMIVDLGLPRPNCPNVTLGIRGITAMTLEMTGSNSDMHSGTNGGIVVNPLHAMVELLSKCRDADGRVTIPGFYDDVQELSPELRKQLDLTFDEAEYRKNFAAEPVGGEKKLSPLERVWLRPTLEINGIGGGYFGSGFKTVIPGQVIAKVSCRLVPDQSPEKIQKLVADFFMKNCPPGVQLKVKARDGGGPAVRALPDAPIVQAVARAYEAVLSDKCRFTLEGGSIPIVTELANTSNADVVLFGYGLNTDNIHAPNEHFGLDRLRLGFATLVRALEEFAG